MEGNRFTKNRFGVSAQYHRVCTQSFLSVCCTLVFMFAHDYILPIKTEIKSLILFITTETEVNPAFFITTHH